MYAYLIQQSAPVTQPQPWPIALSEDLDVESGLGPDDGARLVGFQEGDVQHVVLTAGEFRTDPAAAVGLVPVFSDGRGMFAQGPAVTSAVRRG